MRGRVMRVIMWRVAIHASLSASWAHGEIVAQVSHGAATHKRRANMGIICDELCRQCNARDSSLAHLPCASRRARRSWAERMRSGEEGFCVIKQCCSLDTTQLRLVPMRYLRLRALCRSVARPRNSGTVMRRRPRSPRTTLHPRRGFSDAAFSHITLSAQGPAGAAGEAER